MNFLAHCALGAATDQLLVGGFLGDFVKGPIPDHVPSGIAEGVRLHRRLDAFSATEPNVRASCARLPGDLRRLAPPFVDLLADHFLARHFAAFHGGSLDAFGERAYAAIADAHDWLPPRAQRFFEYLRHHDLFARYQDLAAVEAAFTRISARLGRPEAVAPMMAATRVHYDALAADFAVYYPALGEHADRWLASRAPAAA